MPQQVRSVYRNLKETRKNTQTHSCIFSTNGCELFFLYFQTAAEDLHVGGLVGKRSLDENEKKIWLQES